MVWTSYTFAISSYIGPGAEIYQELMSAALISS